MNQNQALANLPHYYGILVQENGSIEEIPLPHIEDGFQLTLNHQNWAHKDTILRRIFHTVGTNFQPFLPRFQEDQAYEVARQDYVKSLNHLFTIHGMKNIRVEIHDCVKELYLKKIKGF